MGLRRCERGQIITVLIAKADQIPLATARLLFDVCVACLGNKAPSVPAATEATTYRCSLGTCQNRGEIIETFRLAVNGDKGNKS